MRYLLLCLILAGCGGRLVERPPVVEYETVTKHAPSEFYNIPPYPILDITEKTTQRDVALWLISIEERSRRLENQILQLQEYFEGTQ